MEEYDKLVRDEIPAIVEADGARPVTRRVTGDERREYLVAKVHEEIDEYADAGQPEELADVLDVLYALCDHEGVSMDAIEATRAEKRKRRGGFENGIVLERVEDE